MRLKWNIHSTAFRFSLYVFLLSLFLSFMKTGIVVINQYRKQEKMIEYEMQEIKKVYLPSTVFSLWDMNRKQLEIQLKSLLLLPKVQYVELRGDFIAMSYGISRKTLRISHEFPIVRNGDGYDLGSIYVEMHHDDFIELLKKRVMNTLFLHIGEFFLLAVTILLVFRFIVTKHLIALSNHARKINMHTLEDDFSLKRKRFTRHPDELEHLVSAFRQMKRNILEQLHLRKRAEEELLKHRDHLEEMVTQRTAELAEAKDVAEVSNQAKSVFLANMSHDLRTPLYAVLGFSEILFHQEQEPRKKNYLKSIQTSGKSLLSLINNVLDLSKIEAGKLELQHTTVFIRNLFDEMSAIFQHMINSKGIEFLVQADENIPESLLLDETRLRQVLINLLGNAVKFTDKGFIRLTCKGVEIEHDINNRINLIIEVEDSGRGILKEDQQRIFDAFEQVKGQKTSQHKGTGLGLAITHTIAQLMNGSVSVKSEPGHGSTFRIELKDVEIAERKIAGTKNDLEFDPDEIIFAPAKVLIAEDIDYNRDVLSAYLDLFNLKLFFAENGKKAVELAKKHLPDLILMDLKMPEMDGYEASMLLKSEDSTKDIPIIAITASALEQDEEKIRFYCDSYLRKPVSRFVLIKEMKKFLKHTKEKKTVLKTDADIDIVSPMEAELKELYEVALDGDMDGITAYLDKLELKDAKLKEFCKQTRTLALGYQDEKIISLLKDYLSKQSKQIT